MEEKIRKLTVVPSRLSQQVLILCNKNKYNREFLIVIHKNCPPQLEHAHDVEISILKKMEIMQCLEKLPAI